MRCAYNEDRSACREVNDTLLESLEELVEEPKPNDDGEELV